FSTKSHDAAPRESASSPSAPVPAYSSRTRAPGRSATRSVNQASRTSSAVGRTLPAGETRSVPAYLPERILIRRDRVGGTAPEWIGRGRNQYRRVAGGIRCGVGAALSVAP